MRNSIIRRLTLILLLFVGTGALAEAEGKALEGLQAWLDGTRRLEGSFVQSLVSGALGAGLEESGRFFLERPGRMRWEYEDPEQKIALMSGDRTWMYLAEDRQLILGRLDGEGELLPLLMAGEGRVEALFRHEVLEPLDPADRKAVRLRLWPRDGEAAVESVTITVRPPIWAIESAEVSDSAGNQMIYLFHGLVRNGEFPGGLFEFDPPPGTDVVGQH